ncbi:unnamed protein product [Cuscuta europaea]|uniref:Uncharacterized protein n=1 Tax=Cuscuta europaea TaxID=41803 RepID=A0A9P0YR66_CUSEU|nr:unnamed protein product [Cuscuta europaea]
MRVGPLPYDLVRNAKMASSITPHPICSAQSSKEGREALQKLHFHPSYTHQVEGGRRKEKEKRKEEFRWENLCLKRYSRNFHGVEKVAGVVAGVR